MRRSISLDQYMRNWVTGFAEGFSESFMNDFSEQYASGLGESIARKIEEERAKLIRVVMRKNNLSAEEAMKYLEIPRQDREELLEYIFNDD